MVSTTDVGGILNALGGTGRFQLIQLIVIGFGYLPASYHLLDIVFLARSVEHYCGEVIDNGTARNVTYGECSVTTVHGNDTHTQQCSSGYRYTEPADRSIISDLDLVCDRKSLADLTQTLLIGGQAFGAITIPHLSDRFGRKPIYILSTVAMLFVGIGTALAPNYPTFAALRFVIGAIQQGIVTTAATLPLEIFPSQHRKLVSFLLSLIWALCTMTIPLWAYFLRNYSWRILQIAYSSVSLYAIIQIWIVEESISWLVANGKRKQVVRVLKKAARISRVPVTDVMEQLHLLQHKTSDDENKRGNPIRLEYSSQTETNDGTGMFDDVDAEREIITKYTVGDLFKNRRFLVNACILWFTWLTNALTYFGLFLTSSALAGNYFLNFFLNAAAEIPSAIIFYFIIDRTGRKKTSMIFHGMTGIALILATVIKTTAEGPISDVFTTMFALIGKIGITGSFGTIFLYTPELFPTNLRNVGLGMCSAFARIGGMLAPFSNLLAGYAFWAPGSIFGICCLLVTFLMIFLPETTGKELPQTIDDMKTWYTLSQHTVIVDDNDADKTTVFCDSEPEDSEQERFKSEFP